MKKSQVIKSIVYVLILVLLFYWASGVLVAKWRDHNCETDMMREFYRTEKNSVDVLILGSSQVVAGFSPMEMYEKHGISAYSLGSSNQPLFCSYYLLREALERQNISNLVIDVSMLYVRGDRESVRKILDNMPLSKNKLVAIRDQRDMKIAEDQKSLVLPIMKYHTRWKELVAEDFIYEERDKIQYRGGVMMSGLTELNIEGFYIDDDEITEESMYDYELEYFEKILDLCEEKNIDVLLCKTPKSYWNLTKHNEVQEIADARGLDFIDFNLKSNLDAIGFDMTQDMKDKEHANLRGAVKMSDYVGQYLVDHYDLKDHRDTGLFTQEYLDTYHRKYEDTYMVSNGDVADYFQYFDNDRYEILITGDGTLGASWTDEMQQALAQYIWWQASQSMSRQKRKVLPIVLHLRTGRNLRWN